MSKTNILYPVYHSNQRTVFKLDSKKYLNDWRLVGLRAKTEGADANLQFLVGMNAIIKSVTLQSNNLVIDQLRNAHEWLAFEQLRQGNDRNTSLGNELSGSDYGFKLGSLNDHKIPMISFINTTHEVKADRTSDDKTGWLNLKRCLKFLQNRYVLPTDRIPNLSLIIEWMPYNKALFRGTSSGVTGMTIQEPNLIIDEVLDNTPSPDGKLSYKSIEQDRVVIPSVLDMERSDEKYKLNAFNDKFVSRVMCVNQSNVTNTSDTDSSSCQDDEVIQVRLNGRNQFSRPLDNSNKKMDMCSKTWGDLNIPQGCQYAYFDDNDHFLTGSEVNDIRGFCSFGGWVVNERVNDLEVEYKRLGSDVVRDSQGLDSFFFDVFCEVGKVLTYNKAGVIVAYA